MKTLFALCLLSVPCFAQTLQDIDKGKVRMRITVKAFMLKGALCAGGLLEKNKLGKEVLASGGTGADPFAAKGSAGDPFDGSSITIVDLVTQPAFKVGDQRDVTLYPVDYLDANNQRYALVSTNALLAAQGKYKVQMTPSILERMAFNALLSKASDGSIRMQRADSADPFGNVSSDGVAIKLIGTPTAAKLKLYPTAITGTFAVSGSDAWKTWQSTAP